MTKTTHFGFKTVEEKEKAKRVAGVFTSVADKYDIMNDLMSVGLHRLWKRFAVSVSGVREGQRVLDVAGGSADLSRLFLKKVGASGQVILTDINNAMLRTGRDRLFNQGIPHAGRPMRCRTPAPFPRIISIASASPSACATSRTKMPRCAKCSAYSNREAD